MSADEGDLAAGEVATDRLRAALEHLGRASGKRLRPRLLEAATVAIGGPELRSRCRSAGQAVELIHTYSLVHDDLPAMDDDALRRGQPTLHVAFDEATAILVGDGLQTLAFQRIADDEQLSDAQKVALISCLARAAGFAGMVGGQSLDMEATAKPLTLMELQHLHRLKTGALFTAALRMGGIVADASAAQLATLERVGDLIGLAFQIIDDVLDVDGDTATLGKTSGKDAAAGKVTYVSLLGRSQSRAEALRLHDEALQQLDGWGDKANDLRELIGRIVQRNR